MVFELLVLGSGAATPTNRRKNSAQLLNFREKYFLIDCGESTQLQLRKFKIRFQKINHIFISHLHGDHFFGLPGLLSTFQLLGRKNPLHIYGPKELKDFIDMTLKVSKSSQTFEIIHHVTQNKEKELIYEKGELKIYSFPLNHRIETTGFIFEEQPGLKNVIKEKIVQYDISVEEIKSIKKGADLIRGKKIIDNVKLTHPPLPCRSYAYCSDTRYSETYLKYLAGITTIYHEATFTHDLVEKAKETYHSTANQAALVAQKLHAKKLILGHFSTRYKTTDRHLIEASQQFKESYCAEDGGKFFIA